MKARAMDSGDDDMPDIVDVVIAMGRNPQPQSDAAPSPSTPALAASDSGLPAHLADLADRARDYVEAASSANTRRAYASDWKHFSSWCRMQGLEPYPPEPQLV